MDKLRFLDFLLGSDISSTLYTHGMYVCAGTAIFPYEPTVSPVVVIGDIRIFSKATTSHTVGLSGACMCGDGCISRDGGFQAVRVAGENLQIFF